MDSLNKYILGGMVNNNLPGFNLSYPYTPSTSSVSPYSSLSGYGPGSSNSFDGIGAIAQMKEGGLTGAQINNRLLQMGQGNPYKPMAWGDLSRMQQIGVGLGAAQSLMGLWGGLAQYGMAKKHLKQQKKEFQMNWDTQADLTNARMEDRQGVRQAIARDAGRDNELSPEEYLRRFGVRKV